MEHRIDGVYVKAGSEISRISLFHSHSVEVEQCSVYKYKGAYGVT